MDWNTDIYSFTKLATRLMAACVILAGLAGQVVAGPLNMPAEATLPGGDNSAEAMQLASSDIPSSTTKLAPSLTEFANQTATVDFVSPPKNQTSSSIRIPEPASLGLMALMGLMGGGAMAMRRRLG